MLLHFSKFGETTISRESALQLTLDNQYDEGNLTNILNEYCDFIRLTNLNSTKTGTRLGYFIILKQGTDRNQLFVRLKEEEGLSNIRIERDDNLDKI